MEHKSTEKGQALIIIAIAAVALFAFAALALDGSRNFSQKRYAQNAADTSVMAGALAHARNNDITTAALARAASNGFNNDGITNRVEVTIVNSPSGVCPANTTGKDITVYIVTEINTTFGRVLGRDKLASDVTATSRACGSYTGPPFDGNAIVSLAPNGTGYYGNGNADWIVEGGGIFSNSTDSQAAYCQSNAVSITAPSVTTVGGIDLSCPTNIGTETENADQYTYAMYSALLPRQPACNGTASLSSGQWHPQAGADGSRVAFSGDMDFAPGLYCVTNSPGPYHGEITGSEVTFYVLPANFSIKFNGSGNSFNASAPTSGEYAGVLMYVAPQVSNGNLLNTQEIDLRGNGDADIVGSIIAPSASVTMYGNSNSDATINSQIIAYEVRGNGTADIHIEFQSADNYQATLPISIIPLK
jgi:hypothetical protein